MQSKYTKRQKAVYSWLNDENLDAVLIEDTEGRRNSSLRYLCGMPSDALLLLTAAGKSILVPWDVNLAEQFAETDSIVPFTEFSRRIEIAVPNLAKAELPPSPRIELSSITPVPIFDKIREGFSGEIFCREGGIDGLLDDLRAVKDREEITIYRKAAEITNSILSSVLDTAAEEKELSEIDVAFLIEMKARQLGAEGTGFATLAAGPKRSYAIHPFPNYTGDEWGTRGLSILDFGITVEGYTTDVTCTVVRGELSSKQEEMVRLVEQAHDSFLQEVRPGTDTLDIAGKVETFFNNAGYVMPHSLGHGIGLDAHEAPYLRTLKGSGSAIVPGMIFTLEPGLYDKDAGGVRLENDFLVTEAGIEQLTDSRIYRIP